MFTGKVDESFPGIFITDNKPAGQGAILNEDGSVNSVRNPANLGSVIQIFATGTGQTAPASIDGQITGAELPRTARSVHVFFPGPTEGEVLYAGTAPGFVSGATQINVRVLVNLPKAVPLDALGISVRVGDGRVSPVLATVAVR